MILKFNKFWIASLHCVTLAMTHCICSSRHCEGASLRTARSCEERSKAGNNPKKLKKSHVFFLYLSYI